jgi:hypothetical protein
MSQPSQQPNLPQDETPTQRIPRVKTPAPQLSRHEKADPGAADPPAVMAEKADTPRELGKDKPDGAQNYRKRVEEAQLPSDVRKAALREVGKLERIRNQSPESGYIQTWLDTVLGLPWSTKTTTDSIDIQPAHEVDPAAADTEKATQKKPEVAAARAEEAGTARAGPKDDDTVEIPAVRAVPSGGRPPQKLSKQQGKLKLAATGPQKTAQKKAEPAAARPEKAGTAPAGKDDDTIEIPAVRAVPSGGRPPQNLSKQQGKLRPAATDPHQTASKQVEPAATDPHQTASKQVEPAAIDPHQTATAPAVLNGGRHTSPQLPEQQVLGPVPVENPPDERRFRWLALAAIVLAALLIGALLFGANRNGGVTAQSVPTASATAPTVRSPTSEPSDESTGTGGGEPTIQVADLAGSARAFEPVRIQGVYRGGADTFVRVQRREDGSWVFFPLPTRTDSSGRFTAYVELGTGRHRLRMVDPRSGVTSEPFVLVVKG